MRSVERRRPRRRVRHRLRVYVIYAEIAALLMVGILLGIIGGTFYSVSKILPSGLDVAQYKPTEVTKIISSDGVVLAQVYEENREAVPISEIPQDLQHATVAIEDSRFYGHLGIDFRGIFRALYQNLRSGRMSQGGSTLTQQLARNIYLTREKRLSRKLQEIVLALQIERNYSKEQILELYLNQVYYGSGSYGVQTASKIYFGKHVKDLTLSECALLAGLPKKPSSYSPHHDLDVAVGRRNIVLNRMAELGYITAAQRDEAKQEKVKLTKLKPRGLARYKAPWFVTYVIKQLKEEYGADLIYRGGLRVHTTLNYEMQKVAEKELREEIARAKSKHVSQGALVCIDPRTGHIKAMVGSVNPDFTKDQFNRAVQAKRQPGSSFKAFVYTAAVDNGYDPSYVLPNRPITFKGKPWPKNYRRKGGYASSYKMKQAVAISVNTCAVQMATRIGIDQVITYAKLLGIKSPLDRNLSLALGASVVTPLEMASAYGVFATRGMRAEPKCVVKITDRDGGIIEENSPVTRQVLSQQTADIMSEIFRAVVVSGTGYNARRVPDAHGKTGTTSDDRDAWFVGYTPELVATVWAGNDNFSPMKGVWGGNVCAPVWRDFMLKALETYKREKPELLIVGEPFAGDNERDYDRPEAHASEGTDQAGKTMVTICAESGGLATPDCPTTYEVRHKADSEPIGECTLHGARTEERPAAPESSPAVKPESPGPALRPTSRPGPIARPRDRYVTVTICADSGRIATLYCPETVRRRFKADEAPTKQCRIHRPPGD